MRVAFSVCLSVAIVVTIIDIIYILTAKNTRGSKKTVIHLLMCMLMMCITQLIYAQVHTETASRVCLEVYEVFEFWTLYFSASFMANYTQSFQGLEKKKAFVLAENYQEINEKMKMFFMAFGVVDVIAMVINNISELVFTMEPILYYSETVYVIRHPSIIFYIHAIMESLLAISIIISLTSKMINVPNRYTREKFTFVFVMAWATIILRTVSIILRLPYDFTVFCVFAFTSAAALLNFAYLPYVLHNRITKTLVNEMNDGIVLFDNKTQEIIFKNDVAKSLINSELFYKLTYEGFENLKNIVDETPFNYESSIILNGNKRTYAISAKRLLEGSEIIGNLFTFIDRTEEIKKIEKNYYSMTHDALTGIYNFDYFCVKAREEIDDNPNENYYLVTSDIFEFKLFNELFGSEQGDKVLKTTAELLVKYCSNTAIFGRIKDDEFAVLIKAEDYSDGIFIEHIMRLREMFSNENYKIYLNAGVLKITDRNEPIYSMCDKTKMAIMQIKDDYSIVLNHFSNEILKESIHRRWILDELDHALSTSQFKMFLQPQVDARTGEWIGAEALVRWIHPEKGMISPGEFIPVIESAGVISKVDLFIWNQAAMKLAEWKIEGKDELYISVNVSVKDFLFVDIFEVFTGLIRTYGIAPSRLRIEITESVLAGNTKMLTDVITKLKGFGFIVEIDDFGSGYSSLNSLKDFDVDVIKMDMGFLSKSEDEEKSLMIFTDVVKMIQKLDMEIVVEGVEEEEQLKFVSALGCNVIQGYYYSKPIPESEFESRLGL